MIFLVNIALKILLFPDNILQYARDPLSLLRDVPISISASVNNTVIQFPRSFGRK